MELRSGEMLTASVETEHCVEVTIGNIRFGVSCVCWQHALLGSRFLIWPNLRFANVALAEGKCGQYSLSQDWGWRPQSEECCVDNSYKWGFLSLGDEVIRCVPI